MKLKIILLCFTMTICVSCNLSHDKRQETVIKGNMVDDMNDTSTQAVIDSVIYIPLEQSTECIISEISKIQRVNNDYYVLAKSKHNLPQLFKFNGKGKFLNKIGACGNSRNEYLRIESFFVLKNRVYIADSYKKKILVYDTKGKFKESFDGNDNIVFLHDMMPIDDTKAIFTYNINFGENHALYDIVELNSFKTVHSETTKFSAEGGTPYALKELGSDGSNLLLSLPLENKVYSMDKNDYSLNSTYNVEMWGKIPTFRSTDIDDIQCEIEKKQLNILRSFYVSGDMILLNSVAGSILWNKQLNKGFYLNMEDGITLSALHNFPFFPMSVIYSDEDGFYSVYSADEFILFAKQTMLTLKNLPIKNGIDSVRTKMNPIIVKYVPKKNI